MFEWIISGFFFFEKAGFILPVSTQQAHSKQAQPSFYYKPARRIHPDYADTLHG
jgi:hypothetical protein